MDIRALHRHGLTYAEIGRIVGRRGLLQNSSDICANPPLVTVSALGQNNIGARFSSLLRGQCEKSKRDRGHHRGGRR